MGGEYINNKENVLLVGNPGTGKSHLATTLRESACMQGHRVKIFTVTRIGC
jgi:DNA replication protein DnaC